MEPQGIVRNYKSSAYKSLMKFASTGAAREEAVKNVNSAAGKPLVVGAAAGTTKNLAPVERKPSELSVDMSMDPTYGDRSCAMFIMRRSVDLHSVINIIENFYALCDHSFAFSRRLAMLSLLGYDDGRELKDDRIDQSDLQGKKKKNYQEELKLRKKQRSQARLKRRFETILKFLSFTAESYQHYFLGLVSSSSIQDLVQQVFNDGQFKTISEDGRIHASAPQIIVPSHDKALKKSQDKHKKRVKLWHYMYTEREINGLMKFDEEYEGYEGPAFDCLRLWDGKIKPPGEANGSGGPPLTMGESNTGGGDDDDNYADGDDLEQRLQEDLQLSQAEAKYVGSISAVATQRINPFSSGSGGSSPAGKTMPGRISFNSSEGPEKHNVDEIVGLQIMDQFMRENSSSLRK